MPGRNEIDYLNYSIPMFANKSVLLISLEPPYVPQGLNPTLSRNIGFYVLPNRLRTKYREGEPSQVLIRVQ